MKILTPVVLGEMRYRDEQGNETPANPHAHGNLPILEKFKVGTGLLQGAVMAYDVPSDTFLPVVPATGAEGSGLHKTAPFSLPAGGEAVVNHQLVKDGRAIVQVDQVIAGDLTSAILRALYPSDKAITGLRESDPTDPNHRIQLPATFNTVTKGAGATFPIATCIGLSYVVDDYLYVLPATTTNWAATSTIYRAPLSSPTSFTAVGNTPVGFSSANGSRVLRHKDKLYVAHVSTVYAASVDAPTNWVAVGTLPVQISQGSAFIVGSRIYIVGGQIGSTYTPVNNTYSADVSDLSAWRVEAAFPVNLGRAMSYQYGDYQYVIGGETAFDSAYSNKVWRSHKDTPTAWTNIGTIPATLGSINDALIYNGRVFIFGGRINASTYSTTVYSADADNPTSWTLHPALSTARQFATKALVEDTFLVIGGFNGTWLSSIETYNATKTVAANAQGDLVLAPMNTPLIQTLVRYIVDAVIPASTSIVAAVAFDGVWSYYDGAAWVQAASMDAALQSGQALALDTGSLYYVQGLENFAVNGVAAIQVALRLKSSVVSATPSVKKLGVSSSRKDHYETLMVGRSALADISVKHAQGDYAQTVVKNKSAVAMTVTVKVYDGFGAAQ